MDGVHNSARRKFPFQEELAFYRSEHGAVPPSVEIALDDLAISAILGSKAHLPRQIEAAHRTDAKLTDPMIRRALRERLTMHASPEHLVIDEMPVAGGSGIADLVRISNRLEVFEIKSDVDSLRRLSHQMPMYNAAFDRVSIVTTERHLMKIEADVSPWCGIMIAYGQPLRMSIRRAARSNPGVDAISVLNLITRAELNSVAKVIGLRRYSCESAVRICNRIVDAADQKTVQRLVRQRLLDRKYWSPRQRGVEGFD